MKHLKIFENFDDSYNTGDNFDTEEMMIEEIIDDRPFVTFVTEFIDKYKDKVSRGDIISYLTETLNNM